MVKHANHANAAIAVAHVRLLRAHPAWSMATWSDTSRNWVPLSAVRRQRPAARADRVGHAPQQALAVNRRAVAAAHAAVPPQEPAQALAVVLPKAARPALGVVLKPTPMLTPGLVWACQPGAVPVRAAANAVAQVVVGGAWRQPVRVPTGAAIKMSIR